MVFLGRLNTVYTVFSVCVRACMRVCMCVCTFFFSGVGDQI